MPRKTIFYWDKRHFISILRLMRTSRNFLGFFWSKNGRVVAVIIECTGHCMFTPVILAPLYSGFQLRTGTNGLDAFLFQARVPSVSSLLCSCGRGRQTAKHVIIYCSRRAGTWHELRDDQGHLPDFSKLIGTAEGLQ